MLQFSTAPILRHKSLTGARKQAVYRKYAETEAEWRACLEYRGSAAEAADAAGSSGAKGKEKSAIGLPAVGRPSGGTETPYTDPTFDDQFSLAFGLTLEQQTRFGSHRGSFGHIVLPSDIIEAGRGGGGGDRCQTAATASRIHAQRCIPPQLPEWIPPQR